MRYTGFHRCVQFIHGDVRRRWPIALAREIEVDALDELRSAAAAAGLPKPSYTACVTKAAALAIDELRPRYPELNAMLGSCLGFRWLRPFAGISAGVAVAREEDGADRIFVQVIDAPQARPLGEITRLLERAATAPAKELPDYVACQDLYRKPALVQKLMIWMGVNVERLHRRYRGTFSVTTVGKFGVDLQLVMPLTTPIQFGFGAVRRRPVVRGSSVAVAKTMFLTVGFDRRLLNGRPVAELLDRMASSLNTAHGGRWLEEVGVPKAGGDVAVACGDPATVVSSEN